MASALCRLVMCALVISAVAAGTSRGAVDDGICTVVTQYVAREGRRAVAGSTQTYCASYADCHRTADQACCHGWRRDPDSKKLRCIKIDPIDSVAVATDVNDHGDSTSIRRVSNAPKEEGGVRASVRRARGSAAESVHNPVQSETNPRGGQSVPNAEQSGQNSATNLAAKGDGKSEPGVDPPADTALKTGIQPLSSGTSAGTAPPPAQQQPSSSGAGASHPEVMHPGSKNSVHSGHPDVESQTPAREDPRDDPTTGTVAPVSSSAASVSTSMGPETSVHTTSKAEATKVQSQGDQATSSTLSPVGGSTSHTATTASPVAHTPRNGEAPASPVGQSSGKHPNVNESEAPVSPTGQTDNNHPSASKSEAPASPSVNKIEAPDSPTGQSDINHPSASKSEAPASPSVNKIQAPDSPTGQSDNNHPSASKSAAPASRTEESGDNHPSVHNSAVNTPVYTDPNNSTTVKGAEDSGTLTLTGPVLKHGRHVDIIASTDSSQSTAATPIPATIDKITTDNVPKSEATSTSAATLPAQKETTHNSVHTGPSAAAPTTGSTTSTASTQSIYHGGPTAASVAKPTDAPPSHHQNPQTSNTLHYVTEGNNGSDGNAPAGKSSVPAGQQGDASAANANGTSAANANGTSATNCTVAGHVISCTGDNCSLLEHHMNCTNNNGTISTVGLQKAPVAKPLGERARAVPSGGSAAKTASEVTISLLLVAAVAFVAALLYWRTRRRRRYINWGTREPNLHFSNPVYDLESMMEQASLVKLQNAADVEDGGSNDSEHEGASQRQ